MEFNEVVLEALKDAHEDYINAIECNTEVSKYRHAYYTIVKLFEGLYKGYTVYNISGELRIEQEGI